jgi:DNA topoisomerase-1
VGYELSPVYGEKLKGAFSSCAICFSSFNCGARKRFQNFNAIASYSIVEFTNETGKSFKAKLPKNFNTKKEAEDFLNNT